MSETPKRKSLGKGFDALLPTNFDKNILLDTEDRIQKIAVGLLRPSSVQPRRKFDDTALKELADSIREHGIIQPLVATPLIDGFHNLVAGERRWRAAKLAGLKEVPVIVRARKELEQIEIALIENVQRVDLSPVEQALSIFKLHEDFSISYEEIAKKLGKARSSVSNLVRILDLPKDAIDALESGKITEGHTKALLALKDDAKNQAVLLEQIIKNSWSVRQAERFATSIKDGVVDKKAVATRVNLESPMTKTLSKRISAPVAIRRLAKGGRLEITFKSDEDLDRIIGRLG